MEVGAGAGWQAKYLSELGFDVIAIEIQSSNYQALREFDIIDYDGTHIPKEDESIDVIFSSNVLEHVPHIRDFHREMLRVLKPGGLAIHVMPTSTWRTWTTLSFYIRRMLSLLRKKAEVPKIQKLQGTAPGVKKQKTLGHFLFPPCHGVRGNFISETYYFTEFFWSRSFKAAGWQIQEIDGNGIFYSGKPDLGQQAQHAHAKPLEPPVRKFL